MLYIYIYKYMPAYSRIGQSILCNDPGKPEHGSRNVVVAASGVQFDLDTVITFHCDRGYVFPVTPDRAEVTEVVTACLPSITGTSYWNTTTPVCNG